MRRNEDSLTDLWDIIHAQGHWSCSWNICFPGGQSPHLFILSSQQWGLVSHVFIIKTEIIVFLKGKKESELFLFFFFNKRGLYYQHKLYLTRCILTHGHFPIVQMQQFNCIFFFKNFYWGSWFTILLVSGV